MSFFRPRVTRSIRRSVKGPGVIATLALLLFLPQGSQAYVVRTTETGTPVRWQDDEVRVRLDASLGALCGGAEDVMVEALSVWGDSGFLPLSFVLEDGDGAAAGFSGGDRHNDVLALPGPWPYSPSFTAVTVTSYDSFTGAMLDADVVFDATRAWSCAEAPAPGQFDLLDTATHEAGHLIGLTDSDVPTATMHPEALAGSVERRSLDDDDRESLVAAYGPPPQLGRTATGCATAPPGARAQPWEVLLGALALAAGLRPRRRGGRSRPRRRDHLDAGPAPARE
jgi:hypothetical protein